MGPFIAQLIDTTLFLYSLVIIARAFLRVMGADTHNPIMRFVYNITEPVLAPLRQFTIVGMWDFSPVAAFIILMLVRALLSALVLSLLP